jgi:hypothetical protein
MKLQNVVFKVEELKALAALYQKAQQTYAQGSMLLESIPADEEIRGESAEKVEELRRRYEAASQLLLERTGAADIDQAFERVQEQLARLQKFDEIRNEQLNLRTALDLELAMGPVDMEARLEAEQTLQGYQHRLEKLVHMAEQALPSSRVLLLS